MFNFYSVNRNVVYLIENVINGKRYVGQAQNFRSRFYCHKNKKVQTIISRAFRKYGFENFVFTILEDGLQIEHLDEREQYWMDYFNSSNLDIGYNLCKIAGTTRGFHHNNETKKKISEANKERFCGKNNPFYGQHHSKETKNKLRRQKLDYNITDKHRKAISKGRKGIKYSDETKRKIGNGNRGKKRSLEQIKLMSESQRGKVLSKEHKQAISEALKGIIVSDETRAKLSKAGRGKHKDNSHCKKKVKMMDLEENVIEIFDSLTEAVSTVGGNIKSLSACLCKGQFSYKGFRWDYAK